MNEATAKDLARAWYAERVDAPLGTIHTHAEQDATVIGWWYVMVWSDATRVAYGLEISPAGEILPMEL